MPGPRGGTGRTAPRTIRTRLLRILILALAVLLALLGTSAVEQIMAYRNAAATADNARLEITLQGLVHELQKERGLTTGFVGGVGQFSAKLPAQRKATDTARAELDRMLAGRGDAAADSVRESLDRLKGLAGIRAHADDGTGVVKDTFDYFTTTITVLDRLGLGLDDVHDSTLRDAYQTLQILGNAKEFTGEERAIVLGSVRAGRFRGDDYSRFMEIRAGRLAALDVFPRSASDAQVRRLDAAMTTPDAERALSYESVAVRGGGQLNSRGIPPMAWWDSMTSTINGLRDVQISLGADVENRAAGLESAAQRDLLLFVLLALGTIVALGGLALDCVRSVSAPLTDLAQQAREVAGKGLPKAVARVQAASSGESPAPPAPLAVTDKAGAEVREVAEAFDRVQRAAFDLATEQAVLRRNATDSLVSLGRRNQNLVRRQISFINKLEHEDADPATLANLFELDHLATRMRRNAESLLVLAGESSPRPWSTPLSITDVLRASLSEVEEYRRVTLRRIEPAHVNGSVVAEIAHLLAELVENALSFSPPDSDVEIEGRRTSAGYLVAIVDHGLGMDTQALAEANVRLSGTASFMAEPTRFLGHFVVGALARKCGIEVRLGEAPAAGVVARVLIPTALLTEAAPAVAAPKEKAQLPAPRRAADASSAVPEARAGQLVSVAGQPVGTDKEAHDGSAARTPDGPVHRAADTHAQRGEPARGASAARTRNGLVKRPRRSAISEAVSETDRPSRPAPVEPTPDRSPEEISGMLANLRSAHMRGGISVEKEKEREKEKEKGRQRVEETTAPEATEKTAAQSSEKSSEKSAAKSTEKGEGK
ncbi:MULTISPECIES: nitrate- and nitrite sensing domain-containing protein [unclassified Streptomyces]|uniref:sensor histidine kinase n=1 Tax=unclassified Streptomyces TaxID=2593676 RepID=UPI002E80CA66|nr:nitrate- and nitrite sensing domain-containing protein [Streptomyces sp. NBC_00589]WTI40351.1 nitrate- and nitrite sensing domain-containing protein [Streptomyces sp. NBC_00775]WUB25967.1 nitrate- and nitrite sensing domain-containing protein [Streptomyces sp. NBC_00589]